MSAPQILALLLLVLAAYLVGRLIVLCERLDRSRRERGRVVSKGRAA